MVDWQALTVSSFTEALYPHTCFRTTLWRDLKWWIQLLLQLKLEWPRVHDTKNLTFSGGVHKGILQVALQQTAGNWAANHGSSMHECLWGRPLPRLNGLRMDNFSASYSEQQTLRSPFTMIRTLTAELKVVWPAIPYFVPPIARIGGTK